MPPRAQPPFLQKHRARTHDESRAVLCALCFNRGGKDIRLVTPVIVSQIQRFVHSDYSLAKLHLPTSICGSCRQKLSRYEKV